MLGVRDLNRTLWARQGLLDRTPMASPDQVEAAVRHLIGLQAQDNLPPYLALAARGDGFDPEALSMMLEERRLVRMVTMRGTIHLLTADDALALRSFTRAVQEREKRASANVRESLSIPDAEFAEAARACFAGGALPMKELGERLAKTFPDVPRNVLAHRARVDLSLVQVPPRGLWKRSGGVVLEEIDTFLGRPQTEADPAALAERYLAAFGPATGADLSKWSGVPKLGPLLGDLLAAGRIVQHDGPTGKPVFDLPGAEIVPGDTALPARLLGVYDNLWLSHADLERVTAADHRRRWMGKNGGNGNTVFLDGYLEGSWRLVDGRVQVELWRSVGKAQRESLDDEVARVEGLLAR